MNIKAKKPGLALIYYGRSIEVDPSKGACELRGHDPRLDEHEDDSAPGDVINSFVAFITW